MMGDDDFRSEVGDVRPLQVAERVRLQRGDPLSEASKAERREAAQREPSRDDNPLSGNYIARLDPFYPLEFKRPGLQNGVFRKLKQGRYQQEARLDLHRMTVEQARKEVFNFIRQAGEFDLRSLLIVHGKGSHSQSSEALLKSCINAWLPQLDSVQAFCSAQPQHGGLGAVYVLLKKSERQKQENRERFMRGRTSDV